MTEDNHAEQRIPRCAERFQQSIDNFDVKLVSVDCRVFVFATRQNLFLKGGADPSHTLLISVKGEGL